MLRWEETRVSGENSTIHRASLRLSLSLQLLNSGSIFSKDGHHIMFQDSSGLKCSLFCIDTEQTYSTVNKQVMTQYKWGQVDISIDVSGLFSAFLLLFDEKAKPGSWKEKSHFTEGKWTYSLFNRCYLHWPPGEWNMQYLKPLWTHLYLRHWLSRAFHIHILGLAEKFTLPLGRTCSCCPCHTRGRKNKSAKTGRVIIVAWTHNTQKAPLLKYFALLAKGTFWPKTWCEIF